MIDDRDLIHTLERTRDFWPLLRGEQIFMTGGTGFVGSWLLATFARANREFGLGARAVVLTRDPVAAATHFGRLGVDRDVELQPGDGTDFAFPSGRFGFVIHAATQRWFEPSAAQPLGIIEPDTTTTRRVLDFARVSGTARMLFTSSGAVYGRQPADLPQMSEQFYGAPLPTDLDAAYGHSKRASETLCAMYAHRYGITISIARLFAFIGPFLPLDAGYAVGNFIGDSLARRPIAIAGDGTPMRTYLYAADLAIWLWTILFAGRSGRAYNTGGADAISIADLAHIVADEAPQRVAIEIAQQAHAHHAPARYVPDVSRAQTELGLQASVGVREGVRRTISWCERRGVPGIRSMR